MVGKRHSRLGPAVAGLSLLLCLGFPCSSQAHGTGRWCSSSYCDMCNRLHLIAGHGQGQNSVNRMAHSRLVNLHNQSHNPPAPKVDSTPQFVVTEMLKHAFPTEKDVLCDIGCGDGRIVIAAVKEYGCRAVGIEIDERVAKLARENVRKAGVEKSVTIIHGDARKYSMDGITIVTMYLFPDLMEELQPEVLKVKRIVSYSHEIPNVSNLKVMVRGEYPVYIWDK